MSYKIAFKKSVSRDLKKISKDQAERILREIEDKLPAKADSFPPLKGRFAGSLIFVGFYYGSINYRATRKVDEKKQLGSLRRG